MRQIKIAYEKREQEIIEEFKKLGTEGFYERAILATSENDFVTARRMRFVPNGLKLYCYTDRNTRKLSQLEANPNVAVVIGYIQVEGTAKVKGHPFDDSEFIDAYKKAQPEFYDQWRSGQPPREERDLVLVEINPSRIAEYRFADPVADRPEAGIDILNVSKKEAFRIVEVTDPKDRYANAPDYIA
jgi:general stress protein 26